MGGDVSLLPHSLEIGVMSKERTSRVMVKQDFQCCMFLQILFMPMSCICSIDQYGGTLAEDDEAQFLFSDNAQARDTARLGIMT